MWQGVKRVKAEETNALSIASANLAYMAYEYLRDHEKSMSRTLWDFLPFDLQSAKQAEMIDADTAIALIKARDSGNMPPQILRDITLIPNLYAAILYHAKDLAPNKDY